ncbi:MAG: hypothetical protein JO006_12390 [Paucibacter sp.]|nr:hypothetical protein [Roseateles sp.]
MKTATLPSIRVEPELRDQLEGALSAGETVSAFIETSVRQALRKRQLDAEFLARAQASAERVKAGLEQTYTIEESMAELRALTESARARLEKRKVHES